MLYELSKLLTRFKLAGFTIVLEKLTFQLKCLLGRDNSFLAVNKTGMYMVSYSLTSWNGINTDDFATILYLRRNAEKIPGTGFDADVDLTGLTGGMGVTSGKGGMTTFLKLDRGDEIDLYCQHCPKIGNINLCINFEYVI